MTSAPPEPRYVKAHAQGVLAEKAETAMQMLSSCRVCPRDCGPDRTRSERGICCAGFLPKVSSFSPHFGEERPLVGTHGSGTIFLTHCNLGCIFCQNYSISHQNEGREVSFETLAKMMLELQHRGCHNINFVSPTHYVPQILKALLLAVEKGLSVPLVYNTGGYDALDTLRLLDGVIDIYMPDFKYGRGEPATQYSQAPDYPEVAKKALKEMHRQVGDLETDDSGIALSGLLVRHLVLPEGLAGTREVMFFLATEISRNTYVNIMDQYYPCGDIPPGSPLRRRITREEYLQALEAAEREGITRLDQRERRLF